MQRIMNILEIYKKESEKFKIEIDIRDREIEVGREREKKLIKKIWTLEEDIKDIYTY